VNKKYYHSKKTLKRFELYTRGVTLSGRQIAIMKIPLKTENDIAGTLITSYCGSSGRESCFIKRISNLPLPEQVGLIRRFTPLECERLQGFSDNWTEGLSERQRYICLGNAVTTNVITKIGQKLWTSLQRKKEVK